MSCGFLIIDTDTRTKELTNFVQLFLNFRIYHIWSSKMSKRFIYTQLIVQKADCDSIRQTEFWKFFTIFVKYQKAFATQRNQCKIYHLSIFNQL